MAAMVGFVTCLLLLCASVSGTPEKGQWSVSVPLDNQMKFAAFPKHMYKGSQVSVTVKLHCPDLDASSVEISWVLRVSPCALEFMGAEDQINKLSGEEGEVAFHNPVWYEDPPYDEYEFIFNHTGVISCQDGHPVHFEDHSEQGPTVKKIKHRPKNDSDTQETEQSAAQGQDTPAGGAAGNSNAGGANQQAGIGQQGNSNTGGANQQAGIGQQGDSNPGGANQQAGIAQQGDSNPGTQSGTKGSGSSSPASQTNTSGGARKKREATQAPAVRPSTPSPAQQKKTDHPILAKTWADGNFLLILKFKTDTPNKNFIAEVQVRMTWGDNNYMSALDYPLLIFYGVMGLVYIIMGLFWLVLLACNWRDLLRVQFWIGGVIFLGMLEKAVFFAEYENVNKVGVSVSGAVIFAELVSCLKRTLARMLVIIVSLGFGIVKPRLGQAFHKVLFVGALYFILAAIEGCMRATSSKMDQSNQFLLAAVPLAVLDAVICWWIFSSLVQTTRTLRLRRNIVKLTLYHHFTNTLIFAVLASVAYMIWFMTQHKFQDCIKDWKQLWVDEAFWHMLFVVLLFIIMVLWRPTANNQRYAFSPLLDAAEEEEEDDAVMNDAFEGMKMRGKAINGSPKQRDSKNKVEDDLKWVEEHIPSSVADKALPSLLDSDEELMTTKFEMSKME